MAGRGAGCGVPPRRVEERRTLRQGDAVAHVILVGVAASLLALSGSCETTKTTGSEEAMPPITEVLQRHTPELLEIPGVVGTGEGREGGRPAFVIFVEARTRELDARLPASLEGYPVVVRESGKVTAPPK